MKVDARMKQSRKAVVSRVQRESNETVHWIDCGFYLMPVTSSKLSRFELSDVKFVNPLDSILTAHDPVFESAGSFQEFDELEKSFEKLAEKESANRIEGYSMRNVDQVSCSYSFVSRIFYIFSYKWI